MAADDIEVEITIPDETGEDANNNGIADGIEIGQAVERADNAIEQAETAEIVSDIALDSASNATEIAYATEERVTQQEAIINAQTARIEELTATVAGLVEITQNLANVAVADLEKETFQELPPDETPPNKHWLMRPLFGSNNG